MSYGIEEVMRANDCQSSTARNAVSRILGFLEPTQSDLHD
jgi:hypothetical protein